MNTAGSERDRFVLVLFYGVLLLTGYLAFSVVAPFLAPLGWAAVFAMVLNPVQARLEHRVSKPRAATLTTLLAALIAVGPAITVLALLTTEVTSVVQRVQSGGIVVPAAPDVQRWYEGVRAKVLIPLPADPTATLVDAFKTVATYVAGRAGTILQNVASLIFQLFVMLFGLFYFLRDGDRIVGIIRQLLPFEPLRRDRMISQTHDLVVATVGSTFAVAITQGALTGTTLGFLGFQSPVLWGVMTAFTSLLPAVGSGLDLGPGCHLPLRHRPRPQRRRPRRGRHRRHRHGGQRPAASPAERPDDDARAARVHQPPRGHGRLRIHRARDRPGRRRRARDAARVGAGGTARRCARG